MLQNLGWNQNKVGRCVSTEIRFSLNYNQVKNRTSQAGCAILYWHAWNVNRTCNKGRGWNRCRNANVPVLREPKSWTADNELLHKLQLSAQLDCHVDVTVTNSGDATDSRPPSWGAAHAANGNRVVAVTREGANLEISEQVKVRLC